MTQTVSLPRVVSPRQNGRAHAIVNPNGKKTIPARTLNVPSLPLLSVRERRVFEAIRRLNSGGIRPSYRDVMKECGYRSPGYVHVIVMNLEGNGYITTGAFGERRALCCTTAGWGA